jgi:EAL domain-containing protein (putative c-di-GMP-specific phosphodiesterase class I)
VLALGRGLGMAITAEGIENEEQFELLSSLGVDSIQGYLFGRPCRLQQLSFGRVSLAPSTVSAA